MIDRETGHRLVEAPTTESRLPEGPFRLAQNFTHGRFEVWCELDRPFARVLVCSATREMAIAIGQWIDGQREFCLTSTGVCRGLEPLPGLPGLAHVHEFECLDKLPECQHITYMGLEFEDGSQAPPLIICTHIEPGSKN